MWMIKKLNLKVTLYKVSKNLSTNFFQENKDYKESLWKISKSF